MYACYMNGSLDGDFRLSYRHDRCRIISWYSQHPVDGICFVPVLVYSLVQIGRSCGRCSYTRAPFISVRPICFYMAARSIQKSIGIEKKEKEKKKFDRRLYLCFVKSVLYFYEMISLSSLVWNERHGENSQVGNFFIQLWKNKSYEDSGNWRNFRIKKPMV